MTPLHPCSSSRGSSLRDVRHDEDDTFGSGVETPVLNLTFLSYSLNEMTFG